MLLLLLPCEALPYTTALTPCEALPIYYYYPARAYIAVSCVA